MALDSSVVVAVLEKEEGHSLLVEAMAERRAVIGPPTLFEAAMVLASRNGLSAIPALARFLDAHGIGLVDFEETHVDAAVRAFLRYGKGRHPAGLNYGDCMTYAIAKVAGAPLLFVGGDFSKTDVEAAI